MSAKHSPLFWRLFSPPSQLCPKTFIQPTSLLITHLIFPHYFHSSIFHLYILDFFFCLFKIILFSLFLSWPFILASLFSSFCLPSRCHWTCQIYTNGKLSSYSPASFFHKRRQSFPSQAFWGREEKLAWGESSLLLKFYHADVQVRFMLSNKPAHVSLRQAKSLGRNGGWQLLSCHYLNCHNFWLRYRTCCNVIQTEITHNRNVANVHGVSLVSV